MKKAGLVSVTYKDNFGSALQTYATQRAVSELGFETGIFDISGVRRIIDLKKIGFYARRIFAQDEFRYMKDHFMSKSKTKMNSGKYAENMKIRHEKYKEFNDKWLKIMPRANSWGELINQSKTCDCVVVGSDQLWRPSNIAGGYFTLEFVPDNIKKIAYSTSFGVSVLPEFQHKKAKKFLNRIECVSVREISGQKIVKDVTGRDIPVVCDPTMLFTAEEWMDIQDEKPFTDGDYILCYFMGTNPKHREFVKKLKEITGYKIVGLLSGGVEYVASDEELMDEAPFNAGPSEFINLIKNAKFMCTDSFHGTVFSILNRTKFFDFRRYSDDSAFSTNDRLHTLLKWTGLSERMLTGDEDVKKCAEMEIDYDAVLEKVGELRKNSMDYLKKSLEV